MSAALDNRPRMIDLDAAETPLDQIDVSQAELYEHDAHWPFFDRLRAEAPVHYCADSQFGPYWSVTRFDDIVAIDKDYETFSSEPYVLLGDQPEDFETESFLVMDPPRHKPGRSAVQDVVAPTNLMLLEPIIRQRVQHILDELPIGETFDWSIVLRSN